MGPILAMLFPFILVFVVLYANKHQKKSKEAFEKICQEQGWDESLDKGYNLLPQNEEEWKLELRPEVKIQVLLLLGLMLWNRIHLWSS